MRAGDELRAIRPRARRPADDRARSTMRTERHARSSAARRIDAEAPLPTALIPGGPYNTPEQTRRRCGGSPTTCSSAGSTPTAPIRRCREILLREPPRLRGTTAGADLQHGSHRPRAR